MKIVDDFKQFLSDKLTWLIPIGLVVFVIHFILVLCYSLPQQFVPDSIREKSKNYVLPGFHQSWNLFAPNADAHNFKLLSRYYSDGWSEWHHPERVLGHEENFILHRTLRVITRDLSGSANSDRYGIYYIDSIPQMDKIEGSGSFMQAMRFCNEYDKRRGIESRDSLQIKIVYTIIPPMGSDEKSDNIDLVFTPYSLGYAK